MISSISFQNFRGLKELELVNLCPVTLISGKNNAGKSSILEGIFLLFDHAAPQSFIKISRFRNLPVVTDSAVLWTPLFYELDTAVPVQIAARLNSAEMVLKYTAENDFAASQDMLRDFASSVKTSYGSAATSFTYLFSGRIALNGLITVIFSPFLTHLLRQ